MPLTEVRTPSVKVKVSVQLYTESPSHKKTAVPVPEPVVSS